MSAILESVNPETEVSLDSGQLMGDPIYCLFIYFRFRRGL
jgi:hypothetical protein